MTPDRSFIRFEKIGSKLQKEEIVILDEHEFAITYTNDHIAVALNTPENVTESFQLGAYFNLVASEELLKIYRANAPIMEIAAATEMITQMNKRLGYGKIHAE